MSLKNLVLLRQILKNCIGLAIRFFFINENRHLAKFAYPDEFFRPLLARQLKTHLLVVMLKTRQKQKNPDFIGMA